MLREGGFDGCLRLGLEAPGGDLRCLLERIDDGEGPPEHERHVDGQMADEVVDGDDGEERGGWQRQKKQAPNGMDRVD